MRSTRVLVIGAALSASLVLAAPANAFAEDGHKADAKPGVSADKNTDDKKGDASKDEHGKGDHGSDPRGGVHAGGGFLALSAVSEDKPSMGGDKNADPKAHEDKKGDASKD